MSRTLCRLAAGAALAVAVAASPAVAQQTAGTLFPEPFLVEHAVVQTDADGSVFATEPVVDYYGGSWIVSQRADGSRVVVDFARREITEIRPEDSSYTVIGFERMASLVRELQALESTAPARPENDTATKDARGPQLRVVEAGAGQAPGLKRAFRSNALIERPGVRHLQVRSEDPVAGTSATVLDAWFDPHIRLREPALEALEGFEREVLGAAAGGPQMSPADALALARESAGGAVPLLTVRPVSPTSSGAGSVEDSARRIEALEKFPIELVSVPEGYRRSPHPLELMVAHANQEAELREMMGGGAQP